MLKQLVEVAEVLLEMRNYSGSSQIIAGIGHPSVERLKGLSAVCPL